jgi:hypothetical protein
VAALASVKAAGAVGYNSASVYGYVDPTLLTSEGPAAAPRATNAYQERYYMLAAPVSNTKTIYIPLLEEGLDVVRPTQAVVLAGDTFLVLPTPNYDKRDESWEFEPGSVVRCVLEPHDGEDILVARTLA